MEDDIDRGLEAFRKLVPYLRGALWWANNGLVKERQPEFNQRDNHKGHPVLSIRKERVTSRTDVVPMLIGTSGGAMDQHAKNCCVDIVGMTKKEPFRHTYFGSIIEPFFISTEELLSGVKPQKGEYVFLEKNIIGVASEKARLWRAPSFAFRDLMPNWDKPMANDAELRMIDDYCLIHNL